MHRHHERNEGVNPKDEPEHGRRDHPHELEVHLPNQRACIRRRCQSTKDSQLLTDIRSLLLGQRDKRLCRALRMADEPQLRKPRLVEHTRCKGW